SSSSSNFTPGNPAFCFKRARASIDARVFFVSPHLRSFRFFHCHMSELPKIIDMHVHLVGNGRQGSGCWLRLGGTWWQKPLAAYMLNHIGLAGVEVQGLSFDQQYVAHLAKLV